MEIGKRNMTEEMELPNQENIRALGDNEAYSFWKILEVDAIRKVEMKGKFVLNISRERESYSKQNNIDRTL